ncbi:MAG: histidine phosphatase family protein [archaeon]|nr:histidine phosphatase family protein [archaeon]
MDKVDELIQKDKKYLLVIRHGLRADNDGKEPKFGKYDSELSEEGIQSAYNLGFKIYDCLKEKLGDSFKIQLFSSPYFRAIETSLQIVKSIREKNENVIENKINLKNILSEINKENEEGLMPKDYLNSINNTELYQNYDKMGIEIIQDIKINELPKRYESGYETGNRVISFVKYVEREMQYGDTFNVTILVTHASPVYGIKKFFKNKREPIETIKECDCYVYNVAGFPAEFEGILRVEEENK